MTGARIELANPNSYSSPKEYIELHLAPAVAELHRVVNELIVPGSTSAEEWGVDMVPSKQGLFFQPLDRRLDESPKHVVFDGATYQSIPKEILRAKQLKVQLTALVYVKGKGDDGSVVANSHINSCSSEPELISRTLPFGDSPNAVAPKQHRYIIEGKGLDPDAIPVCRRFSLSFIYV